MGYLSKDLGEGFISASPSFVSIGVDGFNLSDLKVEGVEESDDYLVEIQMLDENGIPGQFFDWHHGSSGRYRNDGWYEDDDTRVDGDDYEVTFTKGQGLYFSSVAGAKIVSSGQVLQENVVVDLQDGFTMTANPYPCTIGLSTVEVLDVEESDDYLVEIQMLDENGIPNLFFDWHHGSSGRYRNDGWYEDDDTRVDGDDYEYDVFPGQSLYISGVNGAKIKFNCPEFLAPTAE